MITNTMRIIAVAVALALVALPVSVPAQFGSVNVSFQYRISVSVQATIQQAGVQFLGLRFIPHPGTPLGHVDFDFATTGVCNVRFLAHAGPHLVPIFDSGPISKGRHRGWVENVLRADQQMFVLQASDCYGNTLAHDRVTFWTPPPQIRTVDQWNVSVSVSRRTVRVGY